MRTLLVLLVAALVAAAEPRVRIADPVLVVEGPAGEQRRGRYQFPRIERAASGEVLVFVHVEADAAESYGKPQLVFASPDHGAAWRPDQEAAKQPYGVRLSNGDYLVTATTPALPVAAAALPAAVGTLTSYSTLYTLYRLADLPREMRLIFFDRFRRGARAWELENTELDEPDGLRVVLNGLLPRIWWGDIRMSRDRSLVAVIYPSYGQAGPRFYWQAVCYRSTDDGHTWRFQGRIPYEPDPAADRHAAQRNGFTEPALEILADGSLFCVLRTTDGLGVGPMYYARSRDLGRTWTRPQAFTPTGVMPRLLRLGNGTLVLSSGRPGVDLRFSFDGRGEHWTEPHRLVPLVGTPPQSASAASCGYTDLLPLDRNSFLMVYSWFNRPGADGQPHKAILVRRVVITR